MAKLTRKLTTLVVLLAGFSSVLGAGTQFITGPCTSDADCADSCCGFNSGTCAGPVFAQDTDGGCGFGDPEPNDTAAVALGFAGSTPTANSTAEGTEGNSTEVAQAVASLPTVVLSQPATTLATVVLSHPASVATIAAGTQFITGPCTSDAQCAESCCGFNSGKCAGPILAQEVDGGCGFGDAQPNSIAAQQLGFSG